MYLYYKYCIFFICLVAPVKGVWTTWSDWSGCTAKCNGGIQERKRVCQYPVVSEDTIPCGGNTQEWQTCNNQICAGTSKLAYR